MLEIGNLGWAVMIGLIVVLLAVDLVLATLRPHAVGFREAAAWSLFYIAVAVAFGVVFHAQAGGQYGAEYFAGYLVEKSLSVDNVFVFASGRGWTLRRQPDEPRAKGEIEKAPLPGLFP